MTDEEVAELLGGRVTNYDVVAALPKQKPLKGRPARDNVGFVWKRGENRMDED